MVYQIYNSQVYITMSHSPKLTYEPYNNKSLVVHGGDKLTHSKAFRQINGRWNSRLIQGTGPAWLIPRANETQLVEVLAKINREDELNHMKTTAKSRKEQHKYHRAVSESEYSSDESQHSSNLSTREIQPQDEVTKYYRNFKKTPDSFKTPEYVYEQQRYMLDDKHSASIQTSQHQQTDSEYSESDSGFPEPSHDYDDYKAPSSPDLHSSPEIQTYVKKKQPSSQTPSNVSQSHIVHRERETLPLSTERNHRGLRKDTGRREKNTEHVHRDRDRDQRHAHHENKEYRSNTDRHGYTPQPMHTDRHGYAPQPMHTDRDEYVQRRKHRRQENEMPRNYQEPRREKKRHRETGLSQRHEHRRESDNAVDMEELRYLEAKMAELQSRMAQMSSSRKHGRR